MAVRGYHPASGNQIAGGGVSSFLFFFGEVVNILLEDGPDDEWKTGEEEVVKSNIPVLEDGLT